MKRSMSGHGICNGPCVCMRSNGISFRKLPISAGVLPIEIREAAGKSGQQVVVLIDEYDKPILDNIEDAERATIMREGLKNLYSVLNHAAPYPLP